jgi:hypothetical protein
MTTKKENGMGQLIRIVILSWSAALLTASYAGMLAKMDPTFIATVFTASAATFGINTMNKNGNDDDEKKEEEPRREFVIDDPLPTQEPVWTEPSREMTWEEPSTTLEERVEALETKIEGEDGEGFVTPRTGDI